MNAPSPRTCTLLTGTFGRDLAGLVTAYFDASKPRTKHFGLAGAWEACMAADNQREFGLCGACRGAYVELANIFFDHGVCASNSFNFLITYAAYRSGDRAMIESIKARGKFCPNAALNGGCRIGRDDLIDEATALGADHWAWGLASACRGGQLAAAKRMRNRGGITNGVVMSECVRGGSVTILTEVLRIEKQSPIGSFFKEACRGGSEAMVTYMLPYITDRSNWLNGCLCAACVGGHIAIACLLITRFTDLDFNQGLRGACYSGNHALIDLMIVHGANDWNIGLQGACDGNRPAIVREMVSRGADAIDQELINACAMGYAPVAKVLVAAGAIALNEGLWQACYGHRRATFAAMVAAGATKCGCGKPIASHVF